MVLAQRIPVESSGVVHLVYPHGNRVSTPDAIGRNLGERLEKIYNVHYYDWDEFSIIKPGPNDILIGHACPIPYTIFRRSCQQAGWKRKLLLSPHCHGDDHQPAFNEHVIHNCHLYLAITGCYWFNDIKNSGFSHWLPKMRHLDLAIDRKDFPVIKTSFNKQGKRKVVYIGKNVWYKNIPYIIEIARNLPDMEFAWMGSDEILPGLKPLGWHDLGIAKSRDLLGAYDFMITVGNADGNPTTILEAMAWGLIPVCTPQSGYVGYPSIVNIPLNNVNEAVRTLHYLQDIDENRLLEMQNANWRMLDEHFNWDRFASQVIDAIESDEDPLLYPCSLKRKLEILWAELTNPFWLNLLNLRKLPKRLKRLCLRSKMAA